MLFFARSCCRSCLSVSSSNQPAASKSARIAAACVGVTTSVGYASRWALLREELRFVAAVSGVLPRTERIRIKKTSPSVRNCLSPAILMSSQSMLDDLAPAVLCRTVTCSTAISIKSCHAPCCTVAGLHNLSIKERADTLANSRCPAGIFPFCPAFRLSSSHGLVCHGDHQILAHAGAVGFHNRTSRTEEVIRFLCWLQVRFGQRAERTPRSRPRAYRQ